jgi:hypothetical protein
MLRECGFAHIGDMLASLLSADVQGKSYDGTSAIPLIAMLGANTHGDSARVPLWS